MNLPELEPVEAVTLRGLNIYERPELGGKIVGVAPDGCRVFIVDWKLDERAKVMYACIGGWPYQWVTAFRDGQSNINFVSS